MTNALQALIQEHMTNTGETIADIAARGGLPRQTVSGLLNRNRSGGIPRRPTLTKLAKGLGLSLATVEAAALASAKSEGEPLDHRLMVLIDTAKTLPARDVDVLLATARALTKQGTDTR